MTSPAVADAARRVERRLRGWASRLPGPAQQLVGRLADRAVLLPASSLAFYGLVSTLPLALISLSVVDNLFGADALSNLGQGASRSDVEGAGDIVWGVSSAARSPGWWVYLVTLWPATAYGGGLRRAFLEARDGEHESLPGLKGRAIGLLLVLVLPLVVLGGVPLAFALSRLGSDGAGGAALGIALALVGGTVVGTVLNTLLYKVFTVDDLGWRTTIPVAALVGVLTSAMSLGFVVWVRVANLDQRYGSGALALFMLFGVWLLVVNVLLLAGYHAILEVDGADEG